MAADGTARLWNLERGELAAFGDPGATTLGSFRERERVLAARFAPDGARLLTGSSEGVVRLHGRDGELQAELEAGLSAISALAFAPGGRAFAAADGGGNSRLWHGAGEAATRLRPHGSRVAAAAFSPDGRHLMTASWDGSVHVSPVRAEDVLELADDRLPRDFTAGELGRYGDLLSEETRDRARRVQ